MFDHSSDESGHIVVVVSPLVSLMEDQVKYLRNLLCRVNGWKQAKRALLPFAFNPEA